MMRRPRTSISHREWLDRTYGTRPKLPDRPPVQLSLRLESGEPIVRRITPGLIQTDIEPVRPMEGPTGTIFSLRVKYA